MKIEELFGIKTFFFNLYSAKYVQDMQPSKSSCRPFIIHTLAL